MNWRHALIAVFLAGAAVRAVDLWRPFDGRSRSAWREADTSAIARNFYRESMNPLYPRIDWRGTGPGYVEMEFPFQPFTMAVVYQLTGVHEVVGRIFSYLVSLAGLAALLALALRLMPPWGAVWTGLFYAASPLPVRLATGLQPDGLTLALYITAVWLFVRWLERDGISDLVLATLAIAAMLLSKATTLHIGLLFAVVLVGHRGWKGFRDWRPWAMAVGAILPAFLWYRHAHRFWLEHGNSLGFSNETHWAGMGLFTNPEIITGIARIDLLYVWMPAGALLGLLGLVLGWRNRAVRFSVAWLTIVGIYFLVAGRTTGDPWAAYYHAVAAAPVSLLLGATVALALTRFKIRWDSRRSVDLVALLMFGLAGYSLYQASRITVRDFGPRFMVERHRAALQFAPSIPEGELILANGGPCLDPEGLPVAYNASYMFYWTDRKGFNLCLDEQSVAAVESLASKGVRWYIIEQAALEATPGYEEALREAFTLVDSCSVAQLYLLDPDEP